MSVLVAIGLAAGATGCGGSSSSDGGGGSGGSGGLPKTVVIGSPYDRSGVAAIATIGTDEQRGADLAAGEINAQKVLGSSKLELRAADTKGSKEQTVQALIDMTRSKPVDAVAGFTLTPNFLAAAPLLKQSGLPVLSVGLSGGGVTEAGDNIFRVIPSLNDLYAKSDPGVLDALKPKTAAYLFHEDSETNLVQKDFRKKLAEGRGIKTVADEGASTDAIDYRRQLTKIKSANPDVLYIHVTGSAILTVLTQLRQVGIDAPIMGDASWSLSDVVKDPAAQCAVFPTSWSLDQTGGRNREFVAAYRKKYGKDPSAFSAYAYDGIWALTDAIKAAGTTDKKAVIKSLASLRGFSGALGTYGFDATRKPTQTPLTERIENGSTHPWKADDACTR